MPRLAFRLAGRLLGLLAAGFFLGTVASALAAAMAKRRLVSIGGPEDDSVELVAIFGSLDFRSAARSFRGGSLLSWFAGSQLDLRRATLDPAGGDLELKTIFAGTNVVVPDGWRVSLEGPAIFGANSVPAGASPVQGAPELRVRAFTVFGGTSVSPEAWDLVASDKTLVIGPAPRGSGDEVRAGVAPASTVPGEVSTEASGVDLASQAAPKKRRRRAAADAAAAPSTDTEGESTPAADAG